VLRNSVLALDSSPWLSSVKYAPTSFAGYFAGDGPANGEHDVASPAEAAVQFVPPQRDWAISTRSNMPLCTLCLCRSACPFASASRVQVFKLTSPTTTAQPSWLVPLALRASVKLCQSSGLASPPPPDPRVLRPSPCDLLAELVRFEV
jgi:hypothetical protein